MNCTNQRPGSVPSPDPTGTVTRLIASTTLERLGKHRIGPFIEAEATSGGLISVLSVGSTPRLGGFHEVSITCRGSTSTAEIESGRVLAGVELVVAIMHALDTAVGPMLMQQADNVLRSKASALLALNDLTRWLRALQSHSTASGLPCMLRPRDTRQLELSIALLADRHGLVVDLVNKFDRRRSA